MGYTVQTLKLGVFLAVAADLPLIEPEVIDAIATRYEECGKPALTVAVPLAVKQRLGMCIDYSFKEGDLDLVPVGINVIDGRRIDEEELDEEVCLLDCEEVAVNINTLQELKIAENLFAKALKN